MEISRILLVLFFSSCGMINRPAREEKPEVRVIIQKVYIHDKRPTTDSLELTIEEAWRVLTELKNEYEQKKKK